MVQDFRNLMVWEKSHDLVLGVYRATRSFPKEEVYSLTGQIRRSCVSIPSNIAEGCVKGTDPDFARYLCVAMGSASELEYQLLLARDLGYLEDPEHTRLSGEVCEVKKMLSSFVRKLKH